MDKKRFYQEDVKHAGSYDNQHAFNEETDNYLKSKIKIECPHCKSKISPHLCRTEVHLDGGWRWVGCDYKEPYDEFGVFCPQCKKPIKYTEYTEQ